MDPYNEEKGDGRTSSSCAASAATSPQCDAPPLVGADAAAPAWAGGVATPPSEPAAERTRQLLYQLAEWRDQDDPRLHVSPHRF